MEDYLKALMKELSWIGERAGEKGKKLNTIYIGGGTPTTLSEDQLERLLSHIDSCFPRGELLEYTVEAGRPDSITEGKLRVLEGHGSPASPSIPRPCSRRPWTLSEGATQPER